MWIDAVDDKIPNCDKSQLYVVWIKMERIWYFPPLSLTLQSSRKCFGVFTVGWALLSAPSLTLCISSAVLWRGQSTHSLRRPWSAGMPVLPLQHSTAPGILAFIRVINSAQPFLKAPHPFLCPQAQGWPTLPRCGKHSYVTAAAYFHSHPLPCIICH